MTTSDVKRRDMKEKKEKKNMARKRKKLRTKR
jgi:hypothetical protein